MSFSDWTNHSGLLDVIGPCSQETKTAVTKALQYLGISFVTTGRNAKASSSLTLTLRDETAGNSIDRIEFNSRSGSWRRAQSAPKTGGNATPFSQKSDAQSVSSRVTRAQHHTLPLLLESASDDWTTWLPDTAHVEFLKSRAWHKTDLGPMLEWPYTLRLMTMKMLDDPRPANLYWGRSRVAIYNEPFSVMAASRHPMMMGSTAELALPATYPFLSGVFDEIEQSGNAFSTPEFEMSVEKCAGFVEEAWYDGIFSPIRNTDGSFLGLYNSGFDITDRVLPQRNLKTIHRIAAGPISPETSPWQHLIDVGSAFDRDIPFLVLYSTDEPEVDKVSAFMLRYKGSLGIAKGHPAVPEHLDLYDGTDGFRPLLRAAKAKGTAVQLDMPGGNLPQFLKENVHWRGHGDASTHIVATPLYATGLVTGFLIVGLNPRRRYDESHRQFVEDIGRASSGLLASSVSFQQAKNREERLTHELTQRQRFLQRVAEIATVGICTYSIEGLLTWANPMYFEIVGITPKLEERYNYQTSDHVHDEDQEQGKEAFLRCRETKTACNLEVRLTKTWRPPGSEIDEPCCVMINMRPHVENGQVVDVLCCVSDISHLKWAEKFQTKTAEAAREAKQQQERFIDVTSHEMRNPLSAILQCADDITTVSEDIKGQSAEELKGQLQEALQTIWENARTILFCAAFQKRIVDDILTVSKLESTMLKITPVPVNPRAVVLQCIQAFASEMAARKIQSSFEAQAGYTDLQINETLIDPSRLTQILMNLISNAIKFTKLARRRELCIRVNALRQHPPIDDPSSRIQWFPSSMQETRLVESQTLTSGDPDDVVYLMFEVQDSGTGISQDEMTMLFNRFAQASPKTHVTYGGSGLGLYISRELTELQGGMMGLSSQPGIGSTFVFYIGTRKTAASDVMEPQMAPVMTGRSATTELRNEHPDESPKSRSTSEQTVSHNNTTATREKLRSTLSILYVEDNLVNQRVLSKQLTRAGCTVHTASHGLEALELIKKSKHWTANKAEGLEIDAVLMDWEMPIMDGLTCTKEIRQMEAAGSIRKRLPILGATANARPEQVQTALAAGMDDLIAKPFTIATVLKRIPDPSVKSAV